MIYWEEKGGDLGTEEESGSALTFFTLGWPSINIKDKSILGGGGGSPWPYLYERWFFNNRR